MSWVDRTTNTETSEQPVVSKQARIKEEIGLRKDVEQRTQKVRETARSTEVDSSGLGNAPAS